MIHFVFSINSTRRMSCSNNNNNNTPQGGSKHARSAIPQDKAKCHRNTRLQPIQVRVSNSLCMLIAAIGGYRAQPGTPTVHPPMPSTSGSQQHVTSPMAGAYPTSPAFIEHQQQSRMHQVFGNLCVLSCE
jgi:hypothetical protein